MKKISPVRAFLLAGLLFLPAFALAQGGAPELVKGFGTVGDVVNSFTKNVVTALSTLFATMAMAAFFFGLVQYIWGVRDGKPEKVKAGNQFMIYGLLALFVMFSVWGIITYAQKIFGVTGSTITIPTIEFGKGNTAPNNTVGGLPVTPNGTSASGSSQCPTAGASCRTESGALGTCIQGSASRDYAVYCAPAQNTNTATTPIDPSHCYTLTDGRTCQNRGCSWSNAEMACSQ